MSVGGQPTAVGGISEHERNLCTVHAQRTAHGTCPCSSVCSPGCPKSAVPPPVPLSHALWKPMFLRKDTQMVYPPPCNSYTKVRKELIRSLSLL